MRLLRHLVPLLLLIPGVAVAQTAEPPYRPGLNPNDENPQPVKTRCWNGTTSKWEACATGGSSGGGSSSAVAQGSTTSGQTGPLVQGAVVTGDQAYTAGQTQPLTLAADGRLKVGVSYSANVVPAAPLTTTLRAALIGCRYTASPTTWSDTWTGAVRCTSTGAQVSSIEGALPAGGNTIGLIGNTSFGVSSLPSLPAGTNTIGSIANTGFAINGTLPAFAATPTFNIGTAPTLTVNTHAVTQAAGPWTVQQNDVGAVTLTPATSAASLFSATTDGFAGTSFQLTGTWAGTVSFEGSNDNTNWISVQTYAAASGAQVTSTTTNGAFYTPAATRYFRARVSTYTSGTVGGTALLRATSPITPREVVLGAATNSVGSVTLNAGANSIGSVGLNAGTNTIGNTLRAVYFNDLTASALAASASTTPATRDTGAAAGTAQVWNYFNCFARGDAAGATLSAQASTDGTTWFVSQSIAMGTAATPYTTRIPVFYRYNRCLVTNGSTAQTALTVASSYGE